MSIINSLVLSETQQIEIEYKGENGVGLTRLIIVTTGAVYRLFQHSQPSTLPGT